MTAGLVRSFAPRRRKLSPERAARVAPLLARWSLDVGGPLLDLRAEFSADGPFVLEIGFGGGESLVALAAERPEECVIGVDVHTPGLAAVVDAIDAGRWQHVRVVDGDALEFLDRIGLGALDAVRIFFPDPWPKQRHRPRRLVRADVVARLVDRLRHGGTLHLATDFADYAEQMVSVCTAEPRLAGGVVPRPPWRPLTRYERRGVAAGRTVTDLVFARR